MSRGSSGQGMATCTTSWRRLQGLICASFLSATPMSVRVGAVVNGAVIPEDDDHHRSTAKRRHA